MLKKTGVETLLRSSKINSALNNYLGQRVCITHYLRK